MSTTISNAFRNDPIRSHLTPLDFDSVDGVPESHLWPYSNEPHQKIQTQDGLIPVIDLNDPNATDLIGQACKTWGIFQVTNHGVPLELIKKVEFEARRLFTLPTHEKCKVLRSPSDGSVGYGSSNMASFYGKGLWHEGFSIRGSCVDLAKVIWPHDYQVFCDIADAYQDQMKPLTHKLMHLILQTMDVTQEEMIWATSNHHYSQSALHFNSYPICPDPSHAIGLAPHTDSLFLNVLHQSEYGLEICVEGLGWTAVQPVEGAFVVNVGDLLHIFSNAKFPVFHHRAMVNNSKHRISIAYFYGPSVESTVAPSSKFQKPCYKSLPVKEYLQMKAKHYPNALSFIRI